MEELKACLCCESVAMFRDIQHPFWPKVRVICRTCGLESGEFNTESEAAKAWNTRASGWISVDERLPERPTQNVIVFVVRLYAPWYLDLNQFRDGKWATEIQNGKVTHWQPLPEPPKEMKEDGTKNSGTGCF